MSGSAASASGSDDGSLGLTVHNVCPRSRNERKALGDKDSLEKARLAQREGKEWNDIEQARRLNPVKPLEDSLSFATESERFSTDVAAQDAERRSRERGAHKVCFSVRKVVGMCARMSDSHHGQY